MSIIRLTFLVFLCFSFVLIKGYGQEILHFNRVTLDTLLKEIEQKAPVRISYADYLIPDHQFKDLSFSMDRSWKQNLKSLLKPHHLTFKMIGNQMLLHPVKHFLIQGYVRDSLTHENLPGAHIYLPVLGVGTTTNGQGYFQMMLPEGPQNLRISYLGYQTQTQNLSVDTILFLEAFLSQRIDLPAILVTDSTRAAHQTFNPEYDPTMLRAPLSGFPSLGSSLDLVRYLQFSPGVSTGADGFGGLHVRGGGSGQNLFLLDDTPIYNPFHMLGTISMFHQDVMQDARFYSGTFSAEYGDKAASVLDIRMRDGDRKKAHLNGSIGLLSSHLIIETPLFNKTGSLMIAGQRSHAGSLIKGYSKEQKRLGENEGYSTLNFVDIYLKSSIQLSQKDRIVLNGYWGRDFFSEVDRFQDIFPDTTFKDQYQDDFQWGNLAASIKWHHAFGGKLFSQITSYYSKYHYQSIHAFKSLLKPAGRPWSEGSEFTEFKSSIEDIGIKAEFNFLPHPAHRWKVGLGFKSNHYVPGIIAYAEPNPLVPVEIGQGKLDPLPTQLFDVLNFHSSQIISYVQDTWEFSGRGSLKLGFHTALNFLDTENILSIQPRISFQWHWKPNISLFASMSQMQQTQHLITVLDNGYPNELWIPSSAGFPPQSSWQWETGMIRQKGKTQFEVTGYFKTMANLVDFKEDPGYLTFGSLDNLDASIWEQDLTKGSGMAYGLENQFKYIQENLLLQLTYTWSRSWRTFEQKFDGEVTPYAYDRPHQFSLLNQWSLSPKWTVGLSWQWASGTNITLREGDYEVTDYTSDLLDEFTISPGQIESYRLSSYHRLDVSFKYTFGQKVKQEFKLSIQNIYNRINTPYTTLYHDDEISTVFLSTGLPFIPSMAYHFKF